MPTPTGRLALLVLVGAAVPFVVGTWAAFGAVVGVAVVLFALDAALAPAPASIGLVRRLPEVVPLDTAATLTWRITNPAGRSVRVAVADELAPSLRAATRRVAARVPGRRAVEATVRFRPARRGRFVVRRVAVRVDGPLGLASRQRPRDLPATLRVYPSFHSKKEAELRIARARLLEVGLRSARGRGGGTEFEQLREYTPDDEFRRMDWAATARADKPIVRTYRAERNQTVINLLDNGRVMAARVDDVPKIEHAMDALMALTTVATRLGDRAGLVAFDSTVRAVVPPGAGSVQVGRVTEAMYELQPQLAESDYLTAFTTTLARFRKRTMLVIYTDLVEEALQEVLLPSLSLVVRQHVVVLASVRDPAILAWARGPADHAQDAYRKAAAVHALDQRAATAARLRGLGVTVIDAPPRRLAAELADAYLTVKATGRL